MSDNTFVWACKLPLSAARVNPGTILLSPLLKRLFMLTSLIWFLLTSSSARIGLSPVRIQCCVAAITLIMLCLILSLPHYCLSGFSFFSHHMEQWFAFLFSLILHYFHSPNVWVAFRTLISIPCSICFLCFTFYKRRKRILLHVTREKQQLLLTNTVNKSTPIIPSGNPFTLSPSWTYTTHPPCHNSSGLSSMATSSLCCAARLVSSLLSPWLDSGRSRVPRRTPSGPPSPHGHTRDRLLLDPQCLDYGHLVGPYMDRWRASIVLMTCWNCENFPAASWLFSVPPHQAARSRGLHEASPVSQIPLRSTRRAVSGISRDRPSVMSWTTRLHRDSPVAPWLRPGSFPLSLNIYSYTTGEPLLCWCEAPPTYTPTIPPSGPPTCCCHFSLPGRLIRLVTKSRRQCPSGTTLWIPGLFNLFRKAVDYVLYDTFRYQSTPTTVSGLNGISMLPSSLIHCLLHILRARQSFRRSRPRDPVSLPSELPACTSTPLGPMQDCHLSPWSVKYTTAAKRRRRRMLRMRFSSSRLRRWQRLSRRTHTVRSLDSALSDRSIGIADHLSHNHMVGGGPPDNPIQRIDSTTHSSTTQPACSAPSLSSDEDWWPLYLNHASKLKSRSHERQFERDLLDQDKFHELPTQHWQYELSAMGINFRSAHPPIHQLLPRLSDIAKLYNDDVIPDCDVPTMPLEDALCHTRIVFQRLHQLERKIKKQQSQLNSWYRKKCRASPSTKSRAIESLLLAQQDTKTKRRELSLLYQQLQRKVKSRLKEVKKVTPKSVFVSYDLPPIPVYNRFRLLDEDAVGSPIKSWYDFLPPPLPSENIAVPYNSNSASSAGKLDTPMEVLINTRADLAHSAPSLPQQAKGMAYNVIGGYKSDSASSHATLTVSTWNINCLTGHKARFVVEIMIQDKIDVLLLIDTRHSPQTARSFRRIFVQRLGAGSQLYFSKDPNRRPGEPGGIICVVSPTWGPSYLPQHSRSDSSGQGVMTCIRLRTESSFLSILGTYWPFVPVGASRMEESSKKLYNRLFQYCKTIHPQNPDPISHIQNLMVHWMTSAWEDGCTGFIATGDLNSRWLPTDHGGQRSIVDWANDNYLINGPRLIADRANMKFITFGRRDWEDGSWIDHILHAGDPDNIDILGAFNDLGSLLDDVSDHKPIRAVYRTHRPMFAAVASVPKPRKRPELPRGDKSQIARFKDRLSGMLSQVAPTVDSISEAEEALELASQCIVQVVRELNEESRPLTKRHKDGYSPEYVLRKFHLGAIIDIRRHLAGTKPRWVGYNNILKNVKLAFDQLHGLADKLQISHSDRCRILDVPNASLEFWMSCRSGPTVSLCDDAVKLLRSKLHGRLRKEMRLAQKGYMSYIESQREQGKLRSVIKAILGVHAGRKHQDGLPLEVVTSSSGEVITNPATLHAECTRHYDRIYRIPEDHRNPLHLATDWGPLVQNRENFLTIFQASNIPTWCLDIIFRALQEKPEAPNVRAVLTVSLETPPTLAEFKYAIQHTKTNSAPGPSGLSYNMLKSLPRDMMEWVYDKWIWFWNQPHPNLPISWRWRLLHQLPKNFMEIMGFNDYRPLMLCEVLRKIWSAQVISRILDAWKGFDILEGVHQAFLYGRGTDTATILLQNYIEHIEERYMLSHQSSFDLKKAFDSPSKGLMDWSWRRLGVPDQCAESFAQIDVNGTTVVRSPYAEYVWDKLPYRCVKTAGSYPPGTPLATPDSAIVDSFSPERGTGQGEPSSPTNWNGIADIPATGLRILEDEMALYTYICCEDYDMYRQKSIFYADDIKVDAPENTLLQKKADLLSAFCIVLGLQLSDEKIRRLLQNFLPDKQKSQALSMTVYTVGWVPHTVTVQSTGSSVFLGGIYDLDNSGADTELWLIEKAKLIRSTVVSRQGFSGASKITVVNTSTLNGLIYRAACCALPHTKLQKVDHIIDDIMLDATRNMFSYPRKLLHVSRDFGGLGIPCFSTLTEERKLQKLFSCLRSQQLHGSAAKGILTRNARKHGYTSSPNQRLVVVPIPSVHKGVHSFLDGPQELLQTYGLYICRAGIAETSDNLGCLLQGITPLDDIDLRKYCLDNNLVNISDLTILSNGVRAWSLEGPLERLRPLLPLTPPEGPSPLLSGQFWRLTSNLRSYGLFYNDVVRIEGRFHDKVVVTRFGKTTTRHQVLHYATQIQVPLAFLFPLGYSNSL